MVYDFEKYRDKREKVLGVKRRGLNFGTLAVVVSAVIVLSLGVVAVPRALEYLSTRNLDDAIYKMAGSNAWPQDVVLSVDAIDGVTQVITDTRDTRLIVTFNRLKTDAHTINNFFKNRGLDVDLLNTMDRNHRMSILEKEAEFEAL